MRKLLFILCLALIPAVYAQQLNVDVSVTKVEPFPVAPGQQMDVWVRVTNSGESTSDFSLQLVPEYPFTAAPGQSQTVRVGSIPHNEESVVKYRVAVDNSAIGEEKNITFRYSAYQEDEGFWIQFEYPISIRTRDALATIDQYSVSPIKPGGSSTLSLTVRNRGKELLRNVDLSLDLSALPLSSAGKGTKQRAGTMEPDQSTILSYSIQADPTAELKSYHVPVTFTFQDLAGRNYTEETSISIPVDAEPEVQLSVDSTTITKGSPGKVTLRAINRGVPDIKFVSLSLKQDNSFSLLSASPDAYIGNLDSDDFETVEFEVEPKADSLTLPVDISFKDAYNRDYTRSFQLRLALREKEGNGTAFGIIPWLIIIVLIAFIAWKRRK